MFKNGNYYFEIIKTGKITFNLDGTPVLTATEHKEVYQFINQSTAKKLLDSGKHANDLKPDAKYMRLFMAPCESFTKDGELNQPLFVTIGFFEIDAFIKICPEADCQQICAGLNQVILDLFEEKECKPNNIGMLKYYVQEAAKIKK
jgi:hypothetical protein